MRCRAGVGSSQIILTIGDILMAIRKPSAQLSSITSERSEVVGYLNVNVVLSDGSRQVGGIPLYGDKRGLIGETQRFLVEHADQIENAKFEVSLNLLNEESEAPKLAFA
jgi:hypothetical protein